MNIVSGTRDWDEVAKTLKITDENFVNFLKDVEYSEKTLVNYEVYMKKNAKATSVFGTTLKSIGANLGIMLAITVAVQTLSAAFDYLNVTLEEQQEIVDGLQTEIEGLRIEYDELNSKGNLTAQEEAKLKMLERQLAVKKELLSVEEKVQEVYY